MSVSLPRQRNLRSRADSEPINDDQSADRHFPASIPPLQPSSSSAARSNQVDIINNDVDNCW